MDCRICQRRGALSRFRSHGGCRFRPNRSEELAMKIAIGFVIALAAASLAGCVGYGYPGDYGYGGYPNGSYPGDRYPGSNYPGSGYGNSTVRCESKDRRTRHCNIDTRGGVRLTRRLSDASCVQGRSWGYDSRGVWVSNGCRAEFVSGGGNYGPGYGNRPGDNYYGQTVRRESNDRRRPEERRVGKEWVSTCRTRCLPSL